MRAQLAPTHAVTLWRDHNSNILTSYAFHARLLITRAKALGSTLLITYTLLEESGASLRASGFTPTHKTQGGTWHRAARPRQDKAPISRKIRWERGLNHKTRQLVSSRALTKDLFGQF